MPIVTTKTPMDPRGHHKQRRDMLLRWLQEDRDEALSVIGNALAADAARRSPKEDK